MRISGVNTYLVGNPWKNWLFVRVDTDEGLYGVGEGTLNAFSATVESAIHELEDAYIGQDPTDIELIMQRMTRDIYSEGGQDPMDRPWRPSRWPAGTSLANRSVGPSISSWAVGCASGHAPTPTAGIAPIEPPKRSRPRRVRWWRWATRR